MKWWWSEPRRSINDKCWWSLQARSMSSCLDVGSLLVLVTGLEEKNSQ